MRIISGKNKGKKITFISSSTTRPLKDSVKENIFNILVHTNKINLQIKNSNVLDLFAGIGSFGLECISRGARSVTFVENNSKTSEVLVKNLKQLQVLDKSTLYNLDVCEFLKKKKQKYNIIFLDPPYKDTECLKYLKIIKSNKIFENKHIVIIHREKKTKDNFDNYLNLLFTKEYGRSKIFFGNFN